MVNVSCHDAQEYVTWLSKLTRQTYRLLTKAEFDCAGGAGATTIDSWGDEISKDNANCDDCVTKRDDEPTASPSSSKPNAFGLYGMYGDRLQWVEDCYDAKSDRQTTESSSGVICGLRGLRLGDLVGLPPYSRDSGSGFRLARTLLPPSP